MRPLLDTSAYSAFMRDHPDVRTAVQRPERVYVNPVVLG
jgi:predicted nucleic acid-binding protein